MPDVALHLHNADVMGSKAENILQNVQTHCITCSIAPPIETASQIHFGCALKHQSQRRISLAVSTYTNMLREQSREHFDFVNVVARLVMAMLVTRL